MKYVFIYQIQTTVLISSKGMSYKNSNMVIYNIGAVCIAATYLNLWLPR